MPADIRPAGFAERASLLTTLAAIDTGIRALGGEAVALAEAAGRVLLDPCIAPSDWPRADRAAIDGHALRASDSEAAGDYTPAILRQTAALEAGALPQGAAWLAAAGAPLPAGADAVLPFELTQHGGGSVEVLAPVARGSGVERRASELRAGEVAVAGGRWLRPQDVGLLAQMGLRHATVVRRPCVRLLVLGAKHGDSEVLGPMLRALITRDGGVALGDPEAGLALAQAALGADLVLIAGRSGPGPDDDAAVLIAEADGRLDVHGIAMRPGGSAGFGALGGVSLLLLPGAPLDCLVAYDLLAAPAIRRLAGLPAALPYVQTEAVLDRKIASAVGMTDIVLVRVSEGRAVPLGEAGRGGLAIAVRADGFVVVPEASEGQAPGGIVRVHLYHEVRRHE